MLRKRTATAQKLLYTSNSPNQGILSQWIKHGSTIINGLCNSYQCHKVVVYLVDLEASPSFEQTQKIIALDFIYPAALKAHSRSELAKVAKALAKNLYYDSPQQELIQEIHISFIIKSLTFALGEKAQIGKSEWEEYFVYPEEKLQAALA